MYLVTALAVPCCQNCSEPGLSFELSSLVEERGELVETPVVAIRSYCAQCRDLLFAQDWEGLKGREVLRNDDSGKAATA